MVAAKAAALLDAFDSSFNVRKHHLELIREAFVNEGIRALETDSDEIPAMIPSYVNSLPTGNEKGTFISLDLGGTNCRVAAVQLLGDGKVEVLEVKSAVSGDFRLGKVESLFNWMAELVIELVTVKGRHLFSPSEVDGSETIYLGVTWSFPVNQTDINRGKILRMGKGFSLVNADGRDLVELFHEAFERKGMNARVSAIINDTVGTLVAHAYQNPLARIGVIIATGTNAAYIEKVDNIVKLPKNYRSKHAHESMVINSEIDIFGSPAYLPVTEYDVQLMAGSAQPNFQHYEKMMSGMYMGELTRLVITDFVDKGALFGGVHPGGFDVPYSFQTAFMSAIERDFTAGHSDSINLLTDNYEFLNKPTERDVEIIHHIVKTISTRSAHLAAATTSSLIQKQDLHRDDSTEPIVIGINGSVYEHYPFYEERLMAGFELIYPQNVCSRIKVELARDGGTVGAALVAMLCSSKNK